MFEDYMIFIYLTILLLLEASECSVSYSLCSS